MSNEHLTGSDNYFENFEVGAVYRHARGKTVTENDAVTICHMVMNSASAHFDDHLMKTMYDLKLAHVDESLVFGGVTISIVIGLAYQDTGENVIRELAMDNIKLTGPVLHGSTLYAYTEVLSKEDSEDGAGIVHFRHYGVDQNNKLVFQGERSALVRKRAA
ncbi:MaoC family dehydratase [Maricurvus nonylphenolicus]|uniref:MaoC family dehydratase n=1 Tax=Maricurvus nonylphenolicus TaxID=1008307 RepID=UPI0036F38B47